MMNKTFQISPEIKNAAQTLADKVALPQVIVQADETRKKVVKVAEEKGKQTIDLVEEKRKQAVSLIEEKGKQAVSLVEEKGKQTIDLVEGKGKQALSEIETRWSTLPEQRRFQITMMGIALLGSLFMTFTAVLIARFLKPRKS